MPCLGQERRESVVRPKDFMSPGEGGGSPTRIQVSACGFCEIRSMGALPGGLRHVGGPRYWQVPGGYSLTRRVTGHVIRVMRRSTCNRAVPLLCILLPILACVSGCGGRKAGWTSFSCASCFRKGKDRHGSGQPCLCVALALASLLSCTSRHTAPPDATVPHTPAPPTPNTVPRSLDTASQWTEGISGRGVLLGCRPPSAWRLVVCQ